MRPSPPQNEGAICEGNGQALTMRTKSDDPSSDHLAGDPDLTPQRRLGPSSNKSALTLDRAYRAVYVELTTLPKETGSQRWR
jgi:hypothetical protein